MKTRTISLVFIIAATAICFARTPDGEVQASLGTSFVEVVEKRLEIIARMNTEMDQLTDFFFTPEVAVGLRVVLEPGDSKHNTNGYWVHLFGLKSLWHAIGNDRRSSFQTLLSRRYLSLASEAKSGKDINQKDVAPLKEFLSGELQRKAS